MTDPAEPIEESEYVLRRIHRSFIDESLPIAIRPVAFRPNANDKTGLSVFREGCVEAKDTLTAVPDKKKNDYFVARLAVAELRKLGLTVVPEPDPNGPPGHAVIPELSWDGYHADKQRLKALTVELARQASADIVHRPA